MNRRKFLAYSLSFICSTLVPLELLKCKTSYAASNIGSPPSQETYLQFAMPLSSRTSTNMIILHHIGDTNRDFSAGEIHKWHLANGWAGIGYHYVIRKDGTIERGRPKNSIGAHCYGYNKTSIGINIVGDFETAEPTSAQMASVLSLTAFLCQSYQITPSPQTILGHRDLNTTLCPGKNFYAKIPDLRTNLNTML